ncbi:MAG: choice-of-anchor D domain-containing protein [Planctomycetaceae bacterium]
MRATLAALALALSIAQGCGSGSAPPLLPAVVASLDFLVVSGDGPVARAASLRNPFGGPATLVLAEPAAGAFAPEAGALPRLFSGAAEQEIDVRFTPGAPGEYTGLLNLRFVAESGGRTVEVELSLRAEVEAAVAQPATPRLDFGDVLVGRNRTLELAVRNGAAVSSLTLLGATGLPAGFSIPPSALPSQIPPGVTMLLPVTYTATALGSRAFTLRLSHDAPGGVLDVPVTADTTTWPAELITDFGPVALAGGDTPWLEVTVPPHAISLSVEGVGASGDLLGLRALEGPGGKVYENAASTGDYVWTPSPESYNATLPNTDRADVQLVPGGGTYRFRLTILSGASASLRVRAIVHNRPGGAFTDGLLPLNVFLASGLAVDAAGAGTDSQLQSLLGEVDRILAKRGLRLGAISYFDITDPAFDRIDSEAEFADLLRESAAAPATRLNLFFVLRTLGGGVVGVSAAVAGPARNGTGVSGVMVDYDAGSVATLGYVAAHEIGHYLGLHHTVEQNGVHDFIDDTANCPASGTNSTCATAGNSYMMHWQVLGVDPVVTAGQGRVLHAHPLVGPPSSLSALALRAPPEPLGPIDPLPPGWCRCPAAAK